MFRNHLYHFVLPDAVQAVVVPGSYVRLEKALEDDDRILKLVKKLKRRPQCE